MSITSGAFSIVSTMHSDQRERAKGIARLEGTISLGCKLQNSKFHRFFSEKMKEKRWKWRKLEGFEGKNRFFFWNFFSEIFFLKFSTNFQISILT